jgi:FKBP-type peptidyl-prolyl cis-trans isomerase FklB
MFRTVAVLTMVAGAAAHAQASDVQASGQPPAAPPATTQPAQAGGGFADETQKNSYAVGYDFGRMIRTRKIEVVPETLINGVKDALAGAEGRLTDQEITVLVRGIHNEAMRRLKNERAAQSAKNRAEGAAFLEANKSRSGVVALPSGLQYEVLRPGDGPKPTPDDAVRVQFRGTLLDGKIFDTSETRPEPFIVRPTAVIAGWTEALPLMSVGAKWKLFVPAELGYGDRVADNIPPGSTLIFEVELVSIEPKAKDAKAPETPGQ